MKEAIERLLAAKAAEDAATELRVVAELAVIAACSDVPSEGSKTTEADGYKVTLTQRISRKLDEKAYALIVESIPDGIRPVEVVQSFKVDDKGCRWLAENEPGYWAILSKAITEKPMKMAVKIQEAK